MTKKTNEALLNEVMINAIVNNEKLASVVNEVVTEKFLKDFISEYLTSEDFCDEVYESLRYTYDFSSLFAEQIANALKDSISNLQITISL